MARPPTYQILATLLLSGAVLWAASGTRSGESGMRYGLVVLVTLYYVGVMFGTPYTVDPAGVLYMSAGDVNPTMEQVLRIGRSLFWILLHGWYLLGGPTEDFFEARARQLSALQE